MNISFKQEEDEKRGKFILLEDSREAGEISYVWAGEDKFIIDHTETFEGFSGKGYGKKLVLHAIAYAQSKNVKIVPLCPYAKKVMSNDEQLKSMIFGQ